MFREDLGLKHQCHLRILAVSHKSPLPSLQAAQLQTCGSIQWREPPLAPQTVALWGRPLSPRIWR